MRQRSASDWGTQDSSDRYVSCDSIVLDVKAARLRSLMYLWRKRSCGELKLDVMHEPCECSRDRLHEGYRL